MNPIYYIKKGNQLVFYGYKIKLSDLKTCLLKLTDLSGMLHSFSIRVLKDERPRKKLIIDLEFAPGFHPGNYSADTCLFELIARMRKLSKNFSQLIRAVPSKDFPEVFLHNFQQVCFDNRIYICKNRYYL